MEFTYNAYKQLLDTLQKSGYQFSDYHNYNKKSGKVVILRHDVDMSLENAVKFAEIENGMGVASTYFVLLRTDFYNVASKKSKTCIEKIKSLGHEIGLHFDEVSIPENSEILSDIIKERDILSGLCDCDITTVSMHRPSKETLEANYEIPGMINSYGSVFFNEFKYLSDSRRMWKEPVIDIIKSQQYEKLHILTHAFWYKEQAESIADTAKRFITHANEERYYQLADNIRNIEDIIKAEDLICK